MMMRGINMSNRKKLFIIEKTFESFLDVFKGKTVDEKFEKYIIILEEKYVEYKKFQTKVKYGTKKDGSFSEFVGFLKFFIKSFSFDTFETLFYCLCCRLCSYPREFKCFRGNID